MTEQEYKRGKERFDNYCFLKKKLNKLNVMRRQIDNLGLYQFSVGNGDIKYNIKSMGCEPKLLIETYIKAVIDIQISTTKKEMEDI